MIRIKVVIGYVTPPEALRSSIPAASKDALAAAGLHWHRKMLPGHFKEGAYSKYGYKQRTLGYVKRKRREQGHNKPMVWKGQLRDALTRQAIVRVVGKTATVSMTAARALNFSGRSGYPDMRQEVAAITDGEMQELARVYDGHFKRNLTMKAGRSTRRVG